jgi:hypothetical protein
MDYCRLDRSVLERREIATCCPIYAEVAAASLSDARQIHGRQSGFYDPGGFGRNNTVVRWSEGGVEQDYKTDE